jgi:hypothetical protein
MMPEIEEMDRRYAKIVKFGYYAGLILMFASAAIYSLGINQFLPPEAIMVRWDEPTSVFWGKEGLTNYNFIARLGYSDSIVMLAVSFITLVPVLAVLTAIKGAGRTYQILLMILVFELIVAILQPVYLKL